MTTIPLAEELARHRRTMLSLARSLVDLDDAEDIVQDACTRALAHPPSSAENVRGWLLRITRNLALNRWRSHGREQTRTRAVARDERVEGDVDALDERFEVTLAVAQAVKELGEPYQSVILLRYFEDSPHEEIAKFLGRPLATVRTQLQRGLDLLRQRLDKKYGGRETWGAALLTWIARQPSPPVAPAPPLVDVVVRSAGGALLLMGVTWLVLELRKDEAPQRPASVSTNRVLDDSSAEPMAPGGARELAPMAPALSAVESVEGGRYLIGRVTERAAAGTDALEVLVAPLWREYALTVEPVHASVAVDGTFRVALDALFVSAAANVPEPDELEIVVDHPRCLIERLRLPVDAGSTEPGGAVRYEVEMRLRTAALVHGLLLGPSGEPLAGARAFAFACNAGEPETRSEGWALTEPDGTFVLRLASTGSYALALLADGLRPATATVETILAGTVATGVVQLEAGHALAGVCLRISEPLPGASVAVTAATTGERRLHASGGGPDAEFTWTAERFERARVVATADEEGTFHALGLAPREHMLVLATLPGIDAAMPRLDEPLRVVAPAEGVELALQASLVRFNFLGGGHVSLVARSARGQLTLAVPSGTPATLLAEADSLLSLDARSEDGLPLRFELSSSGPGEVLEQHILLPRAAADAALDLKVDVEPPRDIELWLAFVPEHADRALLTRRVEVVDGRAIVEGLPPGAYRLLVHEGPSMTKPSYYADVERPIELETGGILSQTLEFRLGGLLRLDVRDPRGERRRVQFRILDTMSVPQDVSFGAFVNGVRTQSGWYVTPWAPNELTTPLVAGQYELALWDDDLPERRFPLAIEAGRTVELRAVLDE